MSTKAIVNTITRELKDANVTFYLARNKARLSEMRHARNEECRAAGIPVKRWNELEEDELELDREWLARAAADVAAIEASLAEAKEAWLNNPRARR